MIHPLVMGKVLTVTQGRTKFYNDTWRFDKKIAYKEQFEQVY